MNTGLTGTGQPRILGIFAHPDDEVFCAGGTLARYAAAGAETMVVSATCGQAGQIRDGRIATRQTIGQVRERELRAACARLGVRHARCLDHLDGALPAVDPALLAADIAGIVNAFAPDIVITFGPDGGYGHPDHVAIGAAVTRACAPARRPATCTPLLYHSRFPRSGLLLCEWLATWLAEQATPFRGSDGFAHALALLAEGASTMGFARDAVGVRWFPAGLSIVEQGEPGASLYLMLSGHADVVREDAGGTRHVLQRIRPGEFFGAQALARRGPHDASMVAADGVTCLVLSPHAPTAFAGRGAPARPPAAAMPDVGAEPQRSEALTYLDIAAHMDRKVAALAAHRTQYPIELGMFPPALLQELFGREYFEPVDLQPMRGSIRPRRSDPRRLPHRVRSLSSRVGVLHHSRRSHGR